MNTTENQAFAPDGLASQIAAAIERAMQVPPDRKLWSREQIGNYLGIKRSALDKVLASPGFPDARRPAGGHPRWISGEVMKWAERQL